MADETAQVILADAAVDALAERRKRRFARRRSKREDKLANCENCGTALAGEYCFVCGQHAIDYRRSLWRVVVDAADSFLNWDMKFLKSVAVLMTKPGKLTNDFNAGRRARYLHPLRLYLLASIAFFLLATLLNFTEFKAPKIRLTPEDRVKMDAVISKLSAPDSLLAPQQRARLDAARARWTSPEIIEVNEKRVVFDNVMLRLSRLAAKKELKPNDIIRVERELRLADAVDGKTDSAGAEDQLAPERSSATTPSTNDGRGASVVTKDARDAKPSSFGDWIENRVTERVGEDGTKFGLFFNELRRHVPTMMLCCVPLFALVLKVLYVRQRRFYIEHLVYALHTHTFAYVAVVVIALVALAAERVLPSPFEPVLVFLLSCAAVAQVFVSLRRVYGQGWFMTAVKFLLTGAIYTAAIICALAATAFITLLLPG